MLQNLGQGLQNRKGLAVKFLDFFIIANLAFLALDVFLAHSINNFVHPAEWVPFYFSLGASGLLALTVFTERKRGKYWCRISIGWGGIGIGITGMIFHLNSHFFSSLTLKNLIYAAPFVAPLAFTGLGFLLIMNSMISDADSEWAQWVVFLAGCGWCGNFILSVFDHAQNGFFNPSEWLSVFASAFAVGCLVTLLFRTHQRFFFKFCGVVLGINFIVGIVGFIFHFSANLQLPAVEQIDKFLYGPPLFAPLLFPNLSVLAILGIWKLASNNNPA